MIYGKTGQLSRCLLVNALKYGFRPIVIGRPETPIDDYEAISKRINEYRPDIFINASAYNDVEGAETEYDIAYKINANGPMLMARAAKNANIPIIHVSTDYVFSGEKNTPYSETDETNPINKYGISKLLGEKKVLEENDDHVIIRTSWVFSPYANNFVKTILKKAKENSEPMYMVDDQYNIPTSANDLARSILSVAKKLINEPNNHEIRGIFNVTSNEVTSRLEYAKYVLEKAEEYRMPFCEIIPVNSSFFKSNVKRPKFSALDNTKVKRIYCIDIPCWKNGIDETLHILKNTNFND